ncbi:MAG: GNAT family N-acetyltransferase [Actinomycetota bacterium]|nr:GNAT family N-acetyltransferase [Actinomycetota bacterium]
MLSSNLPQLDGAVWRPLARDDAAAMSRLHNACNEVDRTFLITPGEMDEEFDRYGDQAESGSIGAFTADGEMLALGWAQVPETGRTEHRAFVWLLVHPDVRGRVEDSLVPWIEDAGRKRLAGFADDLPAALYRYDIYEWMADQQVLFERHGYERVRYFTENLRDLSLPVDDAPLGDGLAARTWSEDTVADSLTVHNAAFEDHWGSQPFTLDHWVSFHKGEFFLPETSWIVYDSGMPVAYMSCSKYPHDWEDRGRTEAWIEGIGTLRSHRGRGIASALITMALRAFAEEGLEYACLGVDSESPTGANRIYERIGFVPEKRMITFKKPVD